VAVIFALLPLSTFAQGSIFGTVTNSNLSTPANGEISFFGFLDSTDEEIRIETSVGAGYDNGNWYDDFQNYLTEAAGNPYEFYFFNPANSEGANLEGPIPSNSFQQENIALSSVNWPARPTGLVATSESPTSTRIEWTFTPGLTYHVYRRDTTSNGSFFRIDDPAGSLFSPGVADSAFVDTDLDGTTTYEYVVIAESAPGVYSQHSDPVRLAAGCCLAFRGNVDGDPADAVNISDLTYLVATLFQGGPEPPCPAEADVEASGAVNVSDVTYLVSALFQGGPAPAACP